jgi:hypothetical protein
VGQAPQIADDRYAAVEQYSLAYLCPTEGVFWTWLGAGRNGFPSASNGETAHGSGRDSSSTPAKLEGAFGAEKASYLIDRPPGGWSDLVTNPTLDAKFEAFDAKLEATEHRILAAVDRRLRAQTWITTTTLFAGMAMAALIGRFA